MPRVLICLCISFSDDVPSAPPLRPSKDFILVPQDTIDGSKSKHCSCPVRVVLSNVQNFIIRKLKYKGYANKLLNAEGMRRPSRPCVASRLLLHDCTNG